MNSTKTTGYKPVLLALLGNSSITIIKGLGAFFSGSSSLFSEAVHSFADTLNQALLLIGIKRSTKKSDEEFAYGYGMERFLWALISACGIFFIGAGVTIYHGLKSLGSYEDPKINWFSFLILLISFIVELYTLKVALKDLYKSHKGSTFMEILREGDPTTIAVIYEDGVAVFGVFVAFVSILLFEITGNHVFDAIGSIVIGLCLAVVAILLINKNRQYLISKSAPEEIREKVIEIFNSEPSIEKVIDFKSAILDVGRYRIKAEVEFNGSALLSEIYDPGELRMEYDEINGDYQEFTKFCVEYLDRVPRVMGKKINDIEHRIASEIPGISHIDIEIN